MTKPLLLKKVRTTETKDKNKENDKLEARRISGQNKVVNQHFLCMSFMDFCQVTKNGWHKSWCKGGDVQWMFPADMFPSNVPRFILHWTIHHFTNSIQGSSSMAFPIRYREHHLTVRRRVTLDHGKMVKQSFKHSFILCSFYWSFGCFRKVSFWNTNSGAWSQGHFVDIQEVSVPWQDPCGGGGIAQTVPQVLVPTDWNFNQVGRFSEINDMMMDCMIAGSNCDGSAKQSDLRTPWCTQ